MNTYNNINSMDNKGNTLFTSEPKITNIIRRSGDCDLYNEEGPAITMSDDTEYYYLDNILLSKEDLQKSF